MEKLHSFIISIVLITILFLIFSFLPKNYSYKYNINEFEVEEKYDKKKKSYFFVMSDNQKIFKYSIKNKYLNERGIIKKIDSENSCIYVVLINNKEFSLCNNDDSYETKYAHKKIEFKEIESYQNVKINNVLDKKIYIWNYDGFIVLKNRNYTEVSLFKNDVYEPEIITKIQDAILIADYDQKYHFNKMYLIKTKNNNVELVELDKNVYFNSYILGTHKKFVYLYDKQNELEYKINPFKQTINKNPYELLIEDEWQKTTVTKLNKGNLMFQNNNDYEYVLKDSKLYYKTLNSEILVTDMPVSRIVESDDNEVFFISEDVLYYNSIDKGTNSLVQYSEWKFNNENIYIF